MLSVCRSRTLLAFHLNVVRLFLGGDCRCRVDLLRLGSLSFACLVRFGIRLANGLDVHLAGFCRFSLLAW